MPDGRGRQLLSPTKLRGDSPHHHFFKSRRLKAKGKAAGFRFVWDDRLKQFAHPTGVIVVTAGGRVARYLFGIEYGPRDLRLAIVEASAGKIGSPIDAFLLYCYHYDPMTGRYGLAIMRTVRIAGATTVVCLGLFVGIMLRRERRTQPDRKRVHMVARGGGDRQALDRPRGGSDVPPHGQVGVLGGRADRRDRSSGNWRAVHYHVWRSDGRHAGSAYRAGFRVVVDEHDHR